MHVYIEIKENIAWELFVLKITFYLSEINDKSPSMPYFIPLSVDCLLVRRRAQCQHYELVYRHVPAESRQL